MNPREETDAPGASRTLRVRAARGLSGTGVALALMMLSTPALAGTGVALSYGVTALPKADGGVAPESIVTLRQMSFPDGAPVGLGWTVRAHGALDGYDLGISPDLCFGHIDDDFGLSLCGGLTLYNRGYRDGAKTHGLLSPSVEPTMAIPLARGDAGALFISAPAGYDVRYGGDSGWYFGLTLGFGAIGG